MARKRYKPEEYRRQRWTYTSIHHIWALQFEVKRAGERPGHHVCFTVVGYGANDTLSQPGHGMSGDQLRRLKELEKENERLRRAVSDRTLDKQVLAEAARGPSRRACRVLGQHRSTQRRIPCGRNDEDRLVADMIELARRYGRYGYRRIAALLRDAGWQVNDGSCVRLRAERADHVWSYDIVHHRTHYGRAFRTLNVLDEFTRESLAIRVRRKLFSVDVIDVVIDLFILRGIPAWIRSDNGPEFVAGAVRQWIAAVGARTAFIEPGSSWENGYIESFNARLRDELLNGEIFYTLREAQVLIDSWRRHYNAVRPHGSL